MLAQHPFLIMILAAFGTFMVVLGGVSTWLWFAPAKAQASAPGQQPQAGGRNVGEVVDHKIAA